jgi:hypothetical protein
LSWADHAAQKDALQLQLTLSEEVRSSQELRLHVAYEEQVNIETLKLALRESRSELEELDDLKHRAQSLLTENESLQRWNTAELFSLRLPAFFSYDFQFSR